MRLEDCKEDWALVTGASSGIGREFCRQLAAAGMNVILVARRKEILEELAKELSVRHGVRTLPLNFDLSQPEIVVSLRDRISAQGIRPRLLCNVAAVPYWGRFERESAEFYQSMIQLNVGAMVALCHCFLEDLSSFTHSAIINVSSPAGFQPMPYHATYGASKAFVTSFSQALYGEWKERGILVQTLIPGPTRTEFAKGYDNVFRDWMEPEDVARISLQHLPKETPLVIAAKGAFKQRLFAAVLPARMLIREVGRMFRPPE